MVAAIVIAFREGLEAALIVGIVFGYLRKTGQTARNRSAWAGVIAALLASIGLAVAIQVVGAELEGPAEQIFEGVTMALAVIMLTWMIVWMRYQSRSLKSSIEHELEAAIRQSTNQGLFAVTFLAVIREGVETALFLSAAAFTLNQMDTLVGSLIGLVVAALVGYLIYASTLRLNLRVFFNVTSVLLLIFAAGMLAQSIHEFQEASLIFASAAPLWDLNHLIAQESTVGLMLKAVVGYNAAPTLPEAVGYLVYWVFALFGVRWLVDRRVTRAPRAVPNV